MSQIWKRETCKWRSLNASRSSKLAKPRLAADSSTSALADVRANWGPRQQNGRLPTVAASSNTSARASLSIEWTLREAKTACRRVATFSPTSQHPPAYLPST